jgi:hypothetical protein
MKNAAHLLFEAHMIELGLEFDREFRFHPKRKWRSDYRITNRLRNGSMILIEIDGAVYARGRHTRGKGFENDMRKINAAQSLGYYVWRFSTNMVHCGEARAFLAEHLNQKGGIG